ncbi:MAG: AAA family ATPase [Methanosarcina sp.]|uniref:AAA family ATPase n=1 Tax=Methanosarcina sp. TaxID=2213 RepID=UPI00263253CD|nr:AAA family ATPase [Methanosarcina sp.]MDD3247480.1 AAA family ATPase [Methanosarcina sp.]MDD4249373.1 AAA family ATPase [Methanosarcina sp.]
MKITKITLSPFGCLANKKLEFNDGVNVIEGPNETGKSTIFNAIQKVLFTPSKLKKKDFEKEIERWLPLGGGDTVKVELEFENEGNKYTLKKMWGNTNSSELTLPNGGLVTKEDTIAEMLEPMLRAREGTYRSVLMTYQSGLSRTLDELAKDEDTIYSLGDIVRKSMLETDGVRIDKFNADINELQNNYFARWNGELNCPEDKKRGINNPYKRGVGQILNAFYTKEAVRVELEEARIFEQELDRINKEIADHDKAISRMQSFVEKNEPIVDGIKERQTQEAKQSAL